MMMYLIKIHSLIIKMQIYIIIYSKQTIYPFFYTLGYPLKTNNNSSISLEYIFTLKYNNVPLHRES